MKSWTLFVISFTMISFNKDDLVAELNTLCKLYHSTARDKLPLIKAIRNKLSGVG